MQNSENNTPPIKNNISNNKVAQLLDSRPLKQRKGLSEEVNRLYQKVVDKGKYVADLAKKTNNKELYAKYDQMGTVRGTAEYSIGVEQVDNNGKKIGKSLIDIWLPITESGKEFDFSMYLLHKHNIDLPCSTLETYQNYPFFLDTGNEYCNYSLYGNEEFVQEYVDLINRNLVLGEKNNLLDSETFENALYSGLVGMGTGGLSGLGSIDINTNNTGIVPIYKSDGTIDVNAYKTQLENARENSKNQKQINAIDKALLQIDNTINLSENNTIQSMVGNKNQNQNNNDFSKQIDEGMIKRSDGKQQLPPITSKKESSTGGKVQFPTISNAKDRVQFPMQGNSISYDNNTTISQNSQIAQLPNNSNIQISKNNSINYTGNSNLSFSEQVDNWKQGKFNSNAHLVVFKETPKIYQDIGLDNLSMTLVANKLDRVYNTTGKKKGRYHGLGELIKELPDALSNPLNIVESTTDSNSIVVITRLGDMNDNIVVVSIKPNGNGQMEIDNISKNVPSNVLTSVYGRENYDFQDRKIDGSYKGWMQLNKENNRIIYDIDDGIKKQRINGQWVESPNSANSFVANNIPLNVKNVNNSNILPINSNMQKGENNAPTIENNISNNKVLNY